MPVTKNKSITGEDSKSGKGVRRNIFQTIQAATAQAAVQKLENEYSALFSDSKAASTASTRAPFSEYSMKFNLEDFEYPEDETLDPVNSKVQLDVTALDRYNEDVRTFRRMLLEECRLLPLRGDVDPGLLNRVRIVTGNLSRSCYYGTYKAHSLAESSVVIIVWLLSRKNFPILFQIRILQSLTEMVWTSTVLKLALVRAHGVRILARLMRSGMLHQETLGCWAAYALVTSAIGSGKVIEAARKLPNMDEYVGEMAFTHYWRNWPANFGSILQGILYGPNAVAPVEEEFQFM